MKKLLKYAVLIIVLIAIPLYNVISQAVSSNSDVEADTSKGIAVIEKLASVEIKDAQSSIKAADKARKEAKYWANVDDRVKESLKLIDAGKKTYRQVFKNVYIVGDSLMEGLNAYGILNGNHLVTKVSASLFHLKDNLDTIVELDPPILILHYGINMISPSSAQQNTFINMYSGLIKSLKKSLPDTRIIVSGLFPVDRSIATADRFGYVKTYNSLLKAMCKSLKIDFLDSSSVLKAHPECYQPDGIHQTKSFYYYWLRFIMVQEEISL